MNKIKNFGLMLLMIFSSFAYAQEKSEIVMTQSELESFLATVAETRRAQIRAQKDEKAQKYLSQLRAQYNKGDQRKGGDISNYELLREIDRLNARLDLMSGNASYFPSGANGSNSTIVVPGAQGNTSYLPGQNTQYIPVQNAQPATTGNTEQELKTARAIWELERELDSLKSVQANLANQQKEDALGDLKNQMLSLEERIANAQNQEERRSLLEELLAKFKNYKKQIFFPNNVSDLSAEDYAYVADVSEVLKKYPELSVVLEGFASPRGRADYNKQLSMKRSESVEQALINKGIPKERIVSSFRGEDHTSTEAGARRVDMSIILK